MVNKCIEHNIKVIPIPGASSIVTAMSISGFRDQFLFYGFLPKKENELERVLSHFLKYHFHKYFLFQL